MSLDCEPRGLPTENEGSGSPVYWVALGAFALGMASYVTAGLLPLIGTAFSISTALAAQLITAFTLAYGLGSPLVVALLPARHTRTGLLAALGLFVLANGASALCHDFTGLLLCRALAGVGSGVYLAMGIAACASFSASGRGKAIALIMGGMAGGTVLGVPLGLLLAERLGWTAAFWLIAGLGLAAWLGLLWRLPALPAAKATRLREKLSLLADGRVRVVLSVSLLAAIASLGMYTFVAPLMTAANQGGIPSVTFYLWTWGLGGIAGSFLIAPLADRVRGPSLSFSILLILALSLWLLPAAAAVAPWLAVLPIAVWGAVGWALQVPQNHELLHLRHRQGDGNLAVALNESALYLGSAIGAAGGGLLLAWQWQPRSLALVAAAIAAVGAVLQLRNLRVSR